MFQFNELRKQSILSSGICSLVVICLSLSLATNGRADENRPTLSVAQRHSDYIAFGQSTTLATTDALNDVQFRWETKIPNTANALCIVATKPSCVMGTWLHTTSVPVTDELKYSQHFSLDFEQILKKAYKGKLPFGTYYVGIFAQDASKNLLGELSNVVTVTYTQIKLPPGGLPLPVNKGSFYLRHSFSGKYVCSGELNNGGKLWLWGPIPKGHEGFYTFGLVQQQSGGYFIGHDFSELWIGSNAKQNGGSVSLMKHVDESRYSLELVPVDK